MDNLNTSNIEFKKYGSGSQYADRKTAIAASLVIILLSKKRKKHNKLKKIKKKKRKQKNLEIMQNKQISKETNGASSNNLTSKEAPSLPANSLSENLQKELSLKDAELYRQCLRMDTNSFYELYNLIKPLVQRKDTVMRECISTTERLAITLRYLALGMS